jgi:preflagellin peptidase FlaK
MYATLHSLFIAANVTLTLAFLLYASWSDYKTREVSNLVWTIYAPLALSISIANILLSEPSQLLFFGLSFGVTSVIAILLFYTGGFGGADSKALMCIALALPFSTEALFAPRLPNGVSPLSQIIFPMTIFSNSVLLAAATAVYLLLYNLIWHRKSRRKIFEGTLAHESIGKKLVTLITGCKTPINELREKWHIYPMEDIEEESPNNQLRRLVIIPRDEGRDEIVNRLSEAVKTGKITDRVWATPGLPMLIFVTMGVVVSLLFGDIVWVLVTSVLG